MKRKNPRDLSWIKYGLIAASQSAEDEAKQELRVLHFCGYPKKPTAADVEHLKQELNTDPEFGLVGRMGVDVFIMTAVPSMVEFYKKMGETATETKRKRKRKT